MKLVHRIAHIFYPRESNNHKPKILHFSGLSSLAVFLLAVQLFINFLPNVGLKILGYAANISPEEVVQLVNEKRASNGLPALSMNQTLVSAALAKGTDMINRDYWAHVAPDGTQPWVFFTNANYSYRFAGENLARDFSNPVSAVDAWMASPTHKDNILSDKYKETGVAVVEGDLAGVDTTIIIQLFGTNYVDTGPVVPIAQAQDNQDQGNIVLSPQPRVESLTEEIEEQVFVAEDSSLPQGELTRPKTLVSPFETTKSVSVATVGVLLGVLVVDGVVISRKKINRIGGRTFAHLAFLGMIIVIAIIIKVGQIL